MSQLCSAPMTLENASDSTYEVGIASELPSKLKAKMLILVGGSGSENALSPLSLATVAATYHLNSGGSLIRGRLALHASISIGLSNSDALCLAALVELLHNASLIQDDLQDGDKLRRGSPAVWVKFGSGVAVCTGDLMLSAAYAALGGINRSQAVVELLPIVHDRIGSIIRGQCADVASHSRSVLDEQEYERIVIGKSGALLGLPFELAFTAIREQQWSREARTGAEAFSIAYQIADDLADFELDKSRGSLNVVTVLSASGDPANAATRACQLGLRYLSKAAGIAQRLPQNSGALLLQLCDELRDVFTQRIEA